MTLTDFEYVTINTDNQNWYKGTGCQYPLICPKGTKVKFVGILNNYYGTWFEVYYNGKICYILPEYCDGNVIFKTKSKSMFIAPLNEYVTLTFLRDRYGKEYVMNDNGEIKELKLEQYYE